MTQAKRWRDADQFIYRLKRRGFVEIGDGCFSTVLAKPGSDRVIKVCRYARSDAWPEYVVWAAQHGYAGNLAPRVYSLHRIEGERGGFYVAVIERLEAEICQISETRPDLASEYSVLASALRYGGDPHEQYSAFAHGVRALSHDLRAGLDIHARNVMVIGDRIVLTDPFTEANRKDNPLTAPSRVTSRQFATLQIAA